MYFIHVIGIHFMEIYFIHKAFIGKNCADFFSIDMLIDAFECSMQKENIIVRQRLSAR